LAKQSENTPGSTFSHPHRVISGQVHLRTESPQVHLRSESSQGHLKTNAPSGKTSTCAIDVEKRKRAAGMCVLDSFSLYCCARKKHGKNTSLNSAPSHIFPFRPDVSRPYPYFRYIVPAGMFHQNLTEDIFDAVTTDKKT